MPKLLIRGNGGKENIIPLKNVRTTIGRSVRNDVCIPDPFASRFHAEIRQENDVFFLRDLGSANGTLHNDRLVFSPVKLSPNDEIILGKTKIIFLDDKFDGREITFVEGEELDLSKTVFFEVNKKEVNRKELIDLIDKVGEALLDSFSLEETLNLIISKVFEIIPAERCAVLLRENDQADFKLAIARIRSRNSFSDEIKVSRKVLTEVVSSRRSILISSDQINLTSQTLSLSGVGSIIVAPLIAEDKVLGVIYADSSILGGIFDKEHLSIISTLASVVSTRIEKAKLIEEKLERERLEYELKLAAEIQQRLQPDSIPQLENYEFEGISLPCYEIGGDYYDFILRNDDTVVFALGDVSGKGASAALMMASLHAAIRSQITFDLTRILTAVNQYFWECYPQNRFVTLFIAELNIKSGVVKFINAGHEPALIVRKEKEVEKLESNALPLGLFQNVNYEIKEALLKPGDFLIAFSDGITEASNENNIEFGVDRIADVVQKNIELSASRIRDKVDSAISKFTNNSAFKDDVTLLIVKRKS
ncbi:MAG: SpoIIE family protein phosphatase, partial [Pyrinomonadaceae bacterium]|nr:SpoIIE family protein phosphatase [Pyrinomonadaceae bacterium]